ncbi:MAG TPA: acetyl-CoA carboxylase biotin carboxyl carrier protein subunit [Desulfobacteraceae bacterium]|nr:acetyl-CoA carboxylase biotin carboxyl carrier protein subunit [Deltaproteobacteria bacterium]MBW2355765.1 acetyl-CoA carboxylase biotin carboxyl carrier protein subunit [Deltaproteobacteria bacterium]RLB97515.1 MAG: acetyl-CoA carboxylase biotin carboxyl carrier protein subunit [Deltaproteobacteria bacterium]HDI59875.1 acetyl-CoA carboxylase biotin carboxyl carrier protein subunit [Desulfobacteraceae bacterium]
MTEIKAPMPGTIIEVLVEPGQRVAENQELLILESMKMENPICARDPGTVQELRVKPGKKVLAQQVLLVMQ